MLEDPEGQAADGYGVHSTASGTGPVGRWPVDHLESIAGQGFNMFPAGRVTL